MKLNIKQTFVIYRYVSVKSSYWSPSLYLLLSHYQDSHSDTERIYIFGNLNYDCIFFFKLVLLFLTENLSEGDFRKKIIKFTMSVILLGQFILGFSYFKRTF